MNHQKPKGLLKDIQQPRITPKSAFLRRLERMQKKAAEEAAQLANERVAKVMPFRRLGEGQTP